MLATFTAQSSDSPSALTTYDGVQVQPFGQLQQTIPYIAWLRGGGLFEAALNLPVMEVSI
ncbi:hypothetical protein [uncultured Stenotrophomonas sp.]|uniref:hypothetical protein n=1 Tax=uncultured Stenotrophomonas sp. TaxID=165438 RepID=UPI0025EC179D|nr:hypothetical protein [uncultured Stenotrophomonas sp.]